MLENVDVLLRLVLCRDDLGFTVLVRGIRSPWKNVNGLLSAVNVFQLKGQSMVGLLVVLYPS